MCVMDEKYLGHLADKPQFGTIILKLELQETCCTSVDRIHLAPNMVVYSSLCSLCRHYDLVCNQDLRLLV
jgi:hypothetical protein